MRTRSDADLRMRAVRAKGQWSVILFQGIMDFLIYVSIFFSVFRWKSEWVSCYLSLDHVTLISELLYAAHLDLGQFTCIELHWVCFNVSFLWTGFIYCEKRKLTDFKSNWDLKPCVIGYYSRSSSFIGNKPKPCYYFPINIFSFSL